MEIALNIVFLFITALPCVLFIAIARELRKKNDALSKMLEAENGEEFIDRAEEFLQAVYLPKGRFMSALFRPTISLPSKEEPEELINYIRYHYLVDRRMKYSTARIALLIPIGLFIVLLGLVIFGFTAGGFEWQLLIIFLFVTMLLVASMYMFRENSKEYPLLDKLEERCKEIRG